MLLDQMYIFKRYVLGDPNFNHLPMQQTLPSISNVKNQGTEDIGTRTRIQLGGA